VVALVVGVATLAAAAALLPLHDLPEAVSRLGPLAPVTGVAVGAALLSALVPRTPVSVACGLIFGAVVGVSCAVAVTVVAGTATFVAGRLLGHDFVSGTAQGLGGHRAGRAYDRVQRWITSEGILAVAAVRSLPLGPYGLVGYAYGASAVRVRDYAVGSALAGTPSAVTYALLGAAVGTGRDAGPLTLLPLGITILLTASVALRTRNRLRAAARASADR
jgi:uncharacterized membrane protein YdjX (TVP38/TMEM64 family)